LKYAGPATRAEITAGDLMTRVYRYADDSLMGRLAGTEWSDRATAYIEAEVRRLGLQPGGENGTYFQHPLVSRNVDSTVSRLEIDGARFELWSDVAPRDQGSGVRTFDGAQVIYGGNLGEPSRMISNDAAAGKIVLLTLAREPNGGRAWSVVRSQISSRFSNAAGVAVAQIDHAPPGYIDAVYRPAQVGVVGQTDDAPRPAYFYVSDRAAQAMLGADPDAASPGTVGKTVRGALTFRSSRAPGRNVIAILPGSDASVRGQYVAIGAHNDHVGFRRGGIDRDSVFAFNRVARQQGADDPVRPATAEQWTRIRAMIDSLRAARGGAVVRDSIFNGADDDGSGSMGLLEIAEAMARASSRPRRSTIFIWHVAEELGLFGAEYFTDHPTVPRDSIVAQLNLDMIGRGGAEDVTGTTKDGAEIRGGPGYVQVVGSRRLSTELGDLAERVNTEGNFGLRFDYSIDANGHPQNIYCRSDHYMYARYGIPVAFFTTGGHADYHQVTDEPHLVDYQRLETVARFVRALGERIGNLDHRVVVDKPKPDPRAPCRQ
jgi:hypothetical protein